MYYKLNDDEFERIKRASKITFSDYELIGDFIPVESLVNVIEDLLIEIDEQEEKIKAIEKDRDENYEPIPYERQIGYNERDFY